MPKIDNYKCCICKELIDYKPIRLVKQEYGVHPRYPSQYYQVKNYNFCDKCYATFNRWIKKHKGDERYE